MSFVSIPSFPQYKGRENLFIASPYPGESNNLPQNRNNQTLGFATNDRSVYGYECSIYSNQDWNASIIQHMFVFVLNNSSDLLKIKGKNSKRTTIATLPIVNYFLAKNTDKLKGLDDIYNTVMPLGVNTSSELESVPTFRSPSAVINVVVQGSVDSMYNLFGAEKNIKPLSKCYFVIRKVYIQPGKFLSFSLGLKKNSVESIEGARDKFVYQIVPWVSDNGLPPKIDHETYLGYYYVGRMVESSYLRDIYNKNNDFDDVETLSRHTTDICSKGKLVKFFLA
jgi:hypothetical protein